MSGQQKQHLLMGKLLMASICAALWAAPLATVLAQDADDSYEQRMEQLARQRHERVEIVRVATEARQVEAEQRRLEHEVEKAHIRAERAAVQAERAAAQAEVREESRAELAESRAALEQARSELREAARRVAEIQRTRLHERGGPGVRSYSFSFDTDDDKPRLGLVMGPAPEKGVKVLSVTPESPAQQAGLTSGDIITKVNGNALNEDEPERRLRQFFELLGDLEADKAVTMAYERDGAGEKDISVTPTQLEGFSFMPFAPNVDVQAIIEGVTEAMPVIHLDEEGGPLQFRTISSLRMLGDFELTALDPNLGEYFGTQQGLLVLGVPESMQDQLQRGDVLLQIDGREPKDVDHAFRILRSYEPGEAVNLSILRHKQREEISVTLPEPTDDQIFFRHRIVTPPAPPAPPGAPSPVGAVPAPPPVFGERMVIKT